MKKQLKQLLCLLMVLTMVCALVACGGDEEDIENTDHSSTTTPEASNDAKETTEPSESTESVGTILSTTLWDLTYDETDGWIYDAEEDLYDRDTYSRVTIKIPDPENESSYQIKAYISVNLETPYSFRDDLVRYGFDEYEYGANHSYEMTNVGGVDCVRYESEAWGVVSVRYMGRDEAAGATVTVSIDGDSTDPRAQKLLDGLNIHLTDVGNVDGPWYWEGEPFATTDHQTLVGTYTLNSTWIPFQEDLRTYETFEHAVAVYGEVAYVLTDGVLKQYAYDGASLSNPVDIPLPEDDYAHMNVDQSGNLWLGDFFNPLIRVTEGQIAASYEGPDKVVMDPSGTWGISWFNKPECEKLVLTDGILSTQDITFAELDSISRIFIDDSYIYVCGSAEDGGGHKVFVYDHDGTYQMALAKSDGAGLGSITFVAQTENGFLAMDGNMREVLLWTKDGIYIGSADDGDLFGTHYPWFCGGCKLDDGSILLVMTEDRPDKSAMELIAFKLSGF